MKSFSPLWHNLRRFVWHNENRSAWHNPSVISTYRFMLAEIGHFPNQWQPKFHLINSPFIAAFFAKKNVHLADELKTLVSEIPKENYRFRKTVNKYMGISVNICLKNTDSIRPIANGLKGKGLFVDKVLGEDKRVFGRDLIRMGQEVCNQKMQEICR